MNIKKSRARSSILWSFFSILLLFFIILAVLPSLFSSTKGKEWLVEKINQRIKGSLSIEKLQLSWIGGQSAEKFLLKDEEGNPLFSFDSFSTESTLFSLLPGALFDHYNLEKTLLESPHLVYTKDEKGELTLEKALSKKTKKNSPHNPSKKKNISFHGDISVSHGEVVLSSPKIEPVYLTDVSLELKKNPDIFHVVAKTKQGSVEGEVLASGTFHEKIYLLVDVQQLPLAIFDQWYETSLFTDGFGKTMNLNVELGKTDQSILLSSKIDAPNLQATFNGSTKGNLFVLEPGAQATFSITPAFFKQIIEKSAEEHWRLANKTDLFLKIQQLEFPFAMKSLDWKKILFSGALSLERAEIIHTSLGNFSLNHFEGTLQSADTLQVSYAGQIQGKAGSTQIEGETSVDEEGKISYGAILKGFPVDLFQLAADEALYLKFLMGTTFDLTLRGTYDQGAIESTVSMNSTKATLQGTIEGEDPSVLDIDLNGQIHYSQRYSSILGPEPDVIIHAEGAWENHTFSLPFIDVTFKNPYWTFVVKGKAGERGKIFHPDQVNIEGIGTILQLPVQEGEIVVNEGRVHIQMDGAKNSAHGRIELETTFQGHAENRSLYATAEAKNFVREEKFDFKNAEIEAKGDLSSFPVALLNPFLGENVNLAAFLGPSIDVKFSGTHTPQKENKTILDLEAKGNGFQSNLSVALDGTLSVAQGKPSFIHWELTPARYQSLMHLIRPDQEPSYVLTRGAAVDLNISKFICPAETPTTLKSFLCQSGFISDIKIGAMHFKSRKTSEEMALLDMTGAIEGENFSKAIRLQGKGKFVSPTIPTNEKAGFSLNAQMIGFLTSTGEFHKEGTIDGELTLDLAPVKEITGILPIDEENRMQIQALLGPLVNAHIYGQISQLNGPLTLDIRSSNLKVSLPVYLGGGIITLRHPVEAELTLTEAINELFLKDVTPLLITGAWSEHPIKVSIDSQGFSLPFRPFNLRAALVEKATIDLGKITVKNGGPVQNLMEFLKAKDVSPEGIMEAWFTPIYVTLRDGVASYKRFDALLGGNVHIAMWGRIDLNKDKVRMTLGISPVTLQERFNVKITNKSMFQVKMRGSTSNLELDWSSAYTRIGLIITKSALGSIVGGILEGLIGGALGEEETPPPSTYPFPWQ